MRYNPLLHKWNPLLQSRDQFSWSYVQVSLSKINKKGCGITDIVANSINICQNGLIFHTAPFSDGSEICMVDFTNGESKFEIYVCNSTCAVTLEI